jgi:hypothetical protein
MTKTSQRNSVKSWVDVFVTRAEEVHEGIPSDLTNYFYNPNTIMNDSTIQ